MRNDRHISLLSRCSLFLLLTSGRRLFFLYLYFFFCSYVSADKWLQLKITISVTNINDRNKRGSASHHIVINVCRTFYKFHLARE